MTDTWTASQFFAKRLKQVRTSQGLTVKDLAQRCAAFGTAITDNVIFNIETGRLSVKLDTALALAAVLSVPPVSLLIPPDDPGAHVAITPHALVSANRVAPWFAGTAPLTGGDAQVYAQAAAQLPAHQESIVDFDARVQWQMRRIDAHAEAAAAKVRHEVDSVAGALTEYAARAASPDAAAALQNLKNRLRLDSDTPQSRE